MSAFSCSSRGHRLHQLDHPQRIVRIRGIHRDDCAQYQSLLGQRFVARGAELQARTPYRGRGNRFGPHCRQRAGRKCDHVAAQIVERGLADPRLLAQPVQTKGNHPGIGFSQGDRHLLSLLFEVLHQIVERVATELHTAFQRAVDLYVEPRLDAVAEERNRDAVQQRSGQDRHQRKQPDHAQGQPGAEHLASPVAQESPEFAANQKHEHRDDHAVQPDQHFELLREMRVVGARGDEQKQGDAAQAADHQQQIAQHAGGFGAHGEKPQRTQSDCRFQSRDVRAVIWNGLGNCVVSRRSRTCAS